MHALFTCDQSNIQLLLVLLSSMQQILMSNMYTSMTRSFQGDFIRARGSSFVGYQAAQRPVPEVSSAEPEERPWEESSSLATWHLYAAKGRRWCPDSETSPGRSCKLMRCTGENEGIDLRWRLRRVESHDKAKQSLHGFSPDNMTEPPGDMWHAQHSSGRPDLQSRAEPQAFWTAAGAPSEHTVYKDSSAVPREAEALLLERARLRRRLAAVRRLALVNQQELENTDQELAEAEASLLASQSEAAAAALMVGREMTGMAAAATAAM